ncbi:MAG TPA: acyl-CoA dehydrogenase family protein, partial [Thermoanaerobaculia bacterium]|nr:acyl-CoA dehydrogenase family protein [Thermoanaerobaculia bacterium]
MADTTFLAWPFFEDSHRALARELREWADREIAPLTEHEHDLDGTCRELVRRLASGGWLRYAVGDRLDVRSLCLIRETLARTSGLADFAFALQGLGSGPISLFGSDELRAEWLPRVAAGE